jgi:hypothetical protein
MATLTYKMQTHFQYLILLMLHRNNEYLMTVFHIGEIKTFRCIVDTVINGLHKIIKIFEGKFGQIASRD